MRLIDIGGSADTRVVTGSSGGRRVSFGSAVVLSDAQQLVNDLLAYVLRRAYVGDLGTLQGSGAAYVAGDPLSAACATWQDQSGNGRDGTQSTVMARPLLVPNSINGRAALKFDGVDDVFSLAVGGAFDTFGLVLVGAGTSGGSCGYLGTTGTGAPSLRGSKYQMQTEKGSQLGMNSSGPGVPSTAPYLLAWSYDGSQSVLRVNDTSNTVAVTTTGFSSLNLLGGINSGSGFPLYDGTFGCVIGCRAADMMAIRARLIDYYTLPFAK